ncbi:DUF4906 domain-containing protein [Bacteroides intestinalis]|uniref:DUF4906 domain-containing protein n=2 Tax=Bacteroides TaxID=816 RepID=UPI000E53CA8A|nr:DUF4906 domain-containing protein [Bacteroides intestinalis]RHL11508.1 DUF4906 domain-containing protein [Bacteroides sp. AF39-11AC]
MNDIIMIKKTMVSICVACLVLGGCTEDNLLSDSRMPLSTEPVTVRLTLGIDDYNTSSDGKTRMEEIPHVLSMSSPDMDVELVATPAATRVASSPTAAITEDNAVYSYMGFQFDGTKSDGKLVEKKFFTSPDGSIKTDEVEIKPTLEGQKNMVVILANVNESEFETMIVGNSTYADLQNLCMTLVTDDDMFPRNKVTLPNGGGEKTGIVMCGQTATEISSGKQLYISLKRTVARVKFNIKTTYPHFIDVEHTWNVTLMNIPTQSYYNVIGRKAIFPSESSMDKTGLFWTKSLTTITAANPVIETAPLYIPINLQQVVPTSTQKTRRDNAPSGGTYLQIIGLENKTIPGGNDLNIVKDFSIYQLFLGKNFTTDYSVSANYDLTYNITLKGNSPDDTNVIRLIPGYFSGELTAYNANGTALPSVTDANAVKWQYPNKIELHFSDGYYPAGSSSGSTNQGEKNLKWYAGVAFAKLGATSLTDGRKNTALLQASGTPWEDYAAAYTCYRGTNGYDQGIPAEDILWYLPSVSELIGTWISSSSTQEQLAESYWSSTADPNADKAFVVSNEGKVYSDAVGNTHAVRASQDPDKATHAGSDN